MAKIVIDIDDNLYTRLFDNGVTDAADMLKAYIAIRKGTVLPKNHGKLIDGDAIIAEAKEKMKYPTNHKYMECVIAHMNLAPTIIEADKDGEQTNENKGNKGTCR